MIKIIRNISIVIVLISLAGCFTPTIYKIGEAFNVDNVAKIKIGKTTQQEIKELFGVPWRTGISNGNDVYMYTSEEIIFAIRDSVKRKGNTLVIEFDSNKLVKNYYLNIPGKETILFGYFLHKQNKEKEEAEAAQAAGMQAIHRPPMGRF